MTASRPLGAALLGAVVISFSAIFYQLSGATPATAAFFRALYALLVMAIVVRFIRQPRVRTRRERVLAIASGVFLSVDVWVWQTSMAYIGTGLATLIVNSQVVIVPLVTWAVLSERPSTRAMLAMPVVVAGLVLITGLGAEDTYGSDPVLGVVLATVAALFYSAFLMLYRRSNISLGPVSHVLYDVVLGATAGALLTGLVGGGIDFVPTLPAHGWLLALALGSQVAGWMLIGYALPRLPAAHTSFAILLQPSLTLIWGALIFVERPSMRQLAGVAIVLSGIAAVTTDRPDTASVVT